MKIVKKLSIWLAALAFVGFSANSAQAVVARRVTATLAGTWDASGHHTTGRYFMGHSTQIPSDTISYFIFNLASVKGKHVTDASINVPGSNDWNFTIPWTAHPAGQTAFQGKFKETGLSSRFTLNDILKGMPNARDNWQIYHYEMSEENLSYAWFPDSHTHDFEITPFHGTRFPATLAKVQAAVNGGGQFAVFMVSGFGQTARTEEYGYNGTGLPFNRPVVLTFFTSN